MTPNPARQTGSPLHYGAGEKLIQPEWKVVDDGKGMLTGTLRTFLPYTSGSGGGGSSGGGSSLAPAGGWPTTLHTGGNSLGYAQGSSNGATPVKGDKHPYDSRLVCTSSTISYQGNDISYCDSEYVGLASDPSGVEWEISCPTAEENIEMHPNFMELSTSSKSGQQQGFNVVTQKGIDPDSKIPYWNYDVVEIDSATGKFEGFLYTEETIKNKLAGVKSYKVPRPTYKVSFSTMTASMVKAFLGGVGKVGNLPAFAPSWLNASDTGVSSSGASISSEKKKDWLLTSVSVSEFAGIYKMQCEYTLSDEGGWNSIIYSKGDASVNTTPK